MTAATFDELKEAIAGAYPALPKQLQHIARFALDRPNELALGTVAAVAEAAGVQPSAMIRFANALDFGGFSQMQQVFREHLRRTLDQLSRAHRAAAPQQRPPQGRGRRAAPVRQRCRGRARPARRQRQASRSARRGDVAVPRRARARAGAAARVSDRGLPHLCARPARAAHAAARRRRRHARQRPAQHRAARPAAGDQLPQLFAGGGRCGGRGARARRAGDRHHRQRVLAVEGLGARVLRARRRQRAGVPFAGGAVVPGAGAGGGRGPSAGGGGKHSRRPSGVATEQPREQAHAHRST